MRRHAVAPQDENRLCPWTATTCSRHCLRFGTMLHTQIVNLKTNVSVTMRSDSSEVTMIQDNQTRRDKDCLETIHSSIKLGVCLHHTPPSELVHAQDKHCHKAIQYQVLKVSSLVHISECISHNDFLCLHVCAWMMLQHNICHWRGRFKFLTIDSLTNGQCVSFRHPTVSWHVYTVRSTCIMVEQQSYDTYWRQT